MTNSTEKLREMFDIPLSKEKRRVIINLLTARMVEDALSSGDDGGWLSEVFRYGFVGFEERADDDLIEEIKIIMDNEEFKGSVDEFLEEYGGR